MIRDLFNDIKVQLYERATSPLLVSFVISWCLWNYDFLLILLSGDEPVFKISLIKISIFPSDLSWVLWRVGGPLATALAYIFVYPIPAQWVYRYTRSQHKKMKEIQQEAEDLSPLTVEESRKIRANIRTLERKHDEELSEAQMDNERLKSDLKAVEADRDEALQKLQSDLNNEIHQPNEDVLNVGIEEDSEDSEDSLNDDLADNDKSKLLDPVKEELKNRDKLTDEQKNKFYDLIIYILYIMSKNSISSVSEIIKNVKLRIDKQNIDRIEIEYVIKMMIVIGLVNGNVGNTNIRISTLGNSYIVENNLFDVFG